MKYLRKQANLVVNLIEMIEEAQDHIGEAASILRTVASQVRRVSTEYNMSGNMEAYVINYLTGSRDSIEEKLSRYIAQLEAVADESESNKSKETMTPEPKPETPAVEE